MIDHNQHKIFIGSLSVIFFIVGLLLGASLATNLGVIDLEGVKIGLLFTIIILLLMIGSLVLEVKRILHSGKRRK